MSKLNIIRATIPFYRALLTANKRVSKKFFSALVENPCSVNVQRSRMSSLAGPVKEGNILGSPFGEIEDIADTLPEYIFKGSEDYGDLPAITCGTTGRSYSYTACRAMVQRCGAALLEALKLKPGDTIGLVLPNIPEFVIIIFGSMLAGLRVTFANPLYTAEEISRQFINSQVKCVVTIHELIDKISEVKNSLSDYNGTIIIGGKANYPDGIFTLESLLKENYQIDLPKIDSNSIALIPYSSGTTGLPKGVVLTHKNLVTNLVQVKRPVYRKHEHMDGYRHAVLTVPPFFHIYGFNGILNHNLTLGKHIVSIPRFTPEEYIKCLSKYQPKTLFVVPSLLAFLANHPSVTKDHLASVEDIMVGAAAVTESVAEKFLEKCEKSWDQIRIQQGYGMTESSPVILLTPYISPPSKAMSAGQVLPGTECKIVSLTTGENQEAYKSGELLCRGPQVMQGYLYNEKATKETIDEDGWLHTGDVAYYDDDHYFYIVDRTKELIKVKGNQVSPTELESIIMELKEVADAAVVGVPDHLAGELPKAFIVTKHGKNISTKEIYDWVASKVVKYKRLDGGICFITAIPRNPGGKILRNELKHNVQNDHN